MEIFFVQDVRILMEAETVGVLEALIPCSFLVLLGLLQTCAIVISLQVLGIFWRIAAPREGAK